MKDFVNSLTITPDNPHRRSACERSEQSLIDRIRQFGDCKHVAAECIGQTYDIERLGLKIDVKAKVRSAPVKPHYMTDTNSYQDEFDCDIYAFANYNPDNDLVTFLGWYWKDEYLRDAVFVSKGEFHDNRLQKADGRKMQYRHLRTMREFDQIMSGQFWLIQNKNQVEERIEFFKKWLISEWNWDNAVQFEPKRYVDKRSLSQNALFHLWCKEMAESFSKRGGDVDREQMKELLKYKFLGTEDRVIGKTTIPNQLRSTSKLDKGEMFHFMEKIQAWGFDHGVNLTCPADSEFMKLKGG